MKANATPTLLERISNLENLQTAWNQLFKLNKSSHGLSGETIEQFESNKEDKLRSISDRLKSGKYQFSENRGVLISKGGNKGFRPLQIPEISDRVVIKSIAIELENIFESTIKKSEGYSFAYQKSIGVKDALLKIKEHYENGYKFALEADLKNFFGTVDKVRLLDNEIYKNLPDTTINELIKSALSQKVGNIDTFDGEQKKYFSGIENGIPQGNALSPLLSNIYLSDFDTELIKNGYKLVRYADDFVILCKTNEESKKAYEFSKVLLENLKLEIHSLKDKGKTKISEIDTEKIIFLSVAFDGKNLYPSDENFKKLINKIWELNKDKVPLNVLDYLKKLRNKHDGWISAFIYTDVLRYAEELDFQINRALYMKLNSIDWKLANSSVSKLPKKYSSKNSSRNCLSEKQRISSGIPLTKNLIEFKLKKEEK